MRRKIDQARGRGNRTSLAARHVPLPERMHAARMREPQPGGETAGAPPWLVELLGRLSGEDRIYATLPGGGLLHLDRRLPFLIVYREPTERADAGTTQLVKGEASYLLMGATGNGAAEAELRALLRAIVEAGTQAFGAFLVLELWAGANDSREYRIQGPRGEGAEAVAALAEGLRTLAMTPGVVDVVVEATLTRGPAGRTPLLSARECRELGCLLLGLEVPPVYRAADGTLYPVFLRALQRPFSRALREGIHAFIRVQTTAGIENYRMLGPSRIDELVLEADRELADIEESYEFLLLVSPVDEEEAAHAFARGGYERDPEFHYRLLPVDPDLLKRRLFAIPLERVEDPATAYLLRDKREELDRQVSLLAERNTPDFVASSLRLYGRPDEPLLRTAREILESVPLRASGKRDDSSVDANAFAQCAREEIDRYRSVWEGVRSSVTIRDDVTGLMVSRGQLLIGHTLDIAADRLEALIQHEVGTHVLTYCNGAAQPLHQLRHGLAGYDELQEGLAVLAEYLVDGLSAARMRLLAARVVAVHALLEGATFVDTFRLLHRGHGFSTPVAFSIATRVHTCGGFTRDAIYLRGLLRLTAHLAGGGELEPLYIGKIAEKHINVIQELRDRGVLREPPLRPRFLEHPGAIGRLEAVQRGLPLAAFVRGTPR